MVRCPSTRLQPAAWGRRSGRRALPRARHARPSGPDAGAVLGAPPRGLPARAPVCLKPAALFGWLSILSRMKRSESIFRQCRNGNRELRRVFTPNVTVSKTGMDFLIRPLPDITNSIRNGLTDRPRFGRCVEVRRRRALSLSKVPWLQRLLLSRPTRQERMVWRPKCRRFIPYPVHGERFFSLVSKRKGKQQETAKPSSAHQKRGGLGTLVRFVTHDEFKERISREPCGSPLINPTPFSNRRSP